MGQSNERHILQKLIAFLGANSTLSESMSSPKTDKHSCVLGRGEDVLDCIAQITGASYAEIRAITADSGLPSEQTLVSKIYQISSRKPRVQSEAMSRG